MTISRLSVDLQNFIPEIGFQRIQKEMGDVSLFHQMSHIVTHDLINKILDTLRFGVDIVQMLFEEFVQNIRRHRVLFG